MGVIPREKGLLNIQLDQHPGICNSFFEPIHADDMHSPSTTLQVLSSDFFSVNKYAKVFLPRLQLYQHVCEDARDVPRIIVPAVMCTLQLALHHFQCRGHADFVR